MVFKFKCVSCLGEPLNEEVIKVWKDQTGIWIKEGYGQTETTLVAGTFKGKTNKHKAGDMFVRGAYGGPSLSPFFCYLGLVLGNNVLKSLCCKA
jgi:hypothetical protein